MSAAAASDVVEAHSAGPVPGRAPLRKVAGAAPARSPAGQERFDAAGRELPTLPAVAGLLPGAALRGGAAYSVQGSTALVMAMLAGPSAGGAWCGVVGVPSFGVEAARGFGVDLERLVLVPDPRQDWLGVVAALVDALTVVVVRPPGEVTPGEASRLAARLRSRAATLITIGPWPGSEARLEVRSTAWSGLGEGHGHLAAHRAEITVTGRGAATRPRHHDLWLPAADGSVRPADSTPVGLTAPVHAGHLNPVHVGRVDPNRVAHSGPARFASAGIGPAPLTSADPITPADPTHPPLTDSAHVDSADPAHPAHADPAWHREAVG